MKLIKGNIFTDHRGTVRFVNDFTFDGIKRFYAITHHDTHTIRAWQGHKKETKHFFVTKGIFIINWIAIDNWESPSKDLKINAYTLSDTQSEILTIPPGHVNGFKALEADSTLMVFSDMLLEDSKLDDIRFPFELWKFITQCNSELNTE